VRTRSALLVVAILAIVSVAMIALTKRVGHHTVCNDKIVQTCHDKRGLW
jgi:hypothetical protein